MRKYGGFAIGTESVGTVDLLEVEHYLVGCL
jgi:hypothetical protein